MIKSLKNNRYLLVSVLAASLLLAGVLALVWLPGDSSEPELEEEPPPQFVVSPDGRLPDNWRHLQTAQRLDLNYHRCLLRSEINQDHGRCLTSDRNQPQAEYVYISRSGPQAGYPLPQISYLYFAVPDSATDEQTRIVFENFVSHWGYDESILSPGALEFDHDNQLIAGNLRMFLAVIYNYSDVVFDRDLYHGREFTGEPRVVYASGSGGVAYEYLGNEGWAAGRDGADLPDDCIALDLNFLILSESTPDQLRDYYSDGSPFRVALDHYLEIGGGYDLRLPEAARQKKRDGDVSYDVLIKLYRADAEEYYLTPLDEEVEYGEAYRHPELPSIAMNGCR